MQQTKGETNVCKTPRVVYVKGHQVEVACQKCSQCSFNRRKDLAGRNIAESKFSVASWTMTLTYGRDEDDNVDHLRAAVLTYSDVQSFLKLLRWHGYRFSYTVSGEFGSLEGRAHWHLVIHWKNEPPPRCGFMGFKETQEWHDKVPWSTQDRPVRFNWWRLGEDGKPASEWWPWGYVETAHMTYEGVHYMLKYITKNENDKQAQGRLSMSTNPILGAEFLENLAEKHVGLGIVPQTPSYQFAEIKDREGNTEVFWLAAGSAALDLYLNHFVLAWREVYGDKPIPHSPFVEKWVDKQAKDSWPPIQYRGAVPIGRAPDVKEPDVRMLRPPVPVPQDYESFMHSGEVRKDEETGHYKYVGPGGLTLFYTRTIGGKSKWRNVPGAVVDASLIAPQPLVTSRPKRSASR